MVRTKEVIGSIVAGAFGLWVLFIIVPVLAASAPNLAGIFNLILWATVVVILLMVGSQAYALIKKFF